MGWWVFGGEERGGGRERDEKAACRAGQRVPRSLACVIAKKARNQIGVGALRGNTKRTVSGWVMAHAAAAARPSSMSMVVGLAWRATERRREGAANREEACFCAEEGARVTREGTDVVAALGRRNAPPADARAAPPRADIAMTATQREGSTLRRVCDGERKKRERFSCGRRSSVLSGSLLGFACLVERGSCVFVCDYPLAVLCVCA